MALATLGQQATITRILPLKLWSFSRIVRSCLHLLPLSPPLTNPGQNPPNPNPPKPTRLEKKTPVGWVGWVGLGKVGPKVYRFFTMSNFSPQIGNLTYLAISENIYFCYCNFNTPKFSLSSKMRILFLFFGCIS